MKSYIKKIIACSILGLMGHGLNCEAEARLPKYMARKAAELLMDKFDLKVKPEQKKEDVAKELSGLLYSTQTRQELADGFKNAYDGYSKEEKKTIYKSIDISKINSLQSVLGKLDIGNEADEVNGQFVNERFPCWTGTLTCFMKTNSSFVFGIWKQLINKISSTPKDFKGFEEELERYFKKDFEALARDNVSKKIIEILFLLEFVDDWSAIKTIANSQEEAPSNMLGEYDQYDCVPVPNTAYCHSKALTYKGRSYTSFDYKGTCMLSTIRNLLCILKGNKTFDSFNVKDEIKNYLKKFEDKTEFLKVSGITSLEEQTCWADAIKQSVGDVYQPDLKGFVDTLYGIINDVDQVTKEAYEGLKSDLTEYRKAFKKDNKRWTQTAKIKNSASLVQALTKILQCITKNNNISVEEGFNLENNNKWPVLSLEIHDETTKKVICIATGNVGAGQHIEIIDIKKS